MKAIPLAILTAGLALVLGAHAADSATPKANAAHTAMKVKLARCRADAAAQTPALSGNDAKKFVETCVAKKN